MEAIVCYDQCQFFRFNPMTGEDSCKRPNDGYCPDEVKEMFCTECQEEHEILIGNDICPACGCDELIEV